MGSARAAGTAEQRAAFCGRNPAHDLCRYEAQAARLLQAEIPASAADPAPPPVEESPATLPPVEALYQDQDGHRYLRSCAVPGAACIWRPAN